MFKFVRIVFSQSYMQMSQLAVICLYNYTVGHKKRATLLLSISSPIIDKFSIFFAGTL